MIYPVPLQSFGAPFLVLCSENDDIAPYQSVCKFAHSLQDMGADIKMIMWKSSCHVGQLLYISLLLYSILVISLRRFSIFVLLTHCFLYLALASLLVFSGYSADILLVPVLFELHFFERVRQTFIVILQACTRVIPSSTALL